MGAYAEANGVQALTATPDGAIWVGTATGAKRLDPDRRVWTHYTAASGLAKDRVSSLASTADGALWFGHDEMVSRLDLQTGVWTRQKVEHSDRRNPNMNTMFDRQKMRYPDMLISELWQSRKPRMVPLGSTHPTRVPLA
jgi:ligand-binding sensor domain-containing protein